MSSRAQPYVSTNNLDSLFAEMQKRAFCYDFDGAIQVLQRAHKVDPSNEKIMVDLGGAYAKAYDFSSADEWFQKAIRVSKTRIEALNAVGHQWMDVRHFEAAQKCFERILQEGNVPMATFARLVEIYIRVRRLDDAVQMADRALHTYGPHEAVLLMRARIHRQRGELVDAERAMRWLVSKPEHNPETRAAAWYELAAVLDQMGFVDRAWAALLEAKALMNLKAAQPKKILKTKQASLKAMSENIPNGIVQKWRKAGAAELQPAHRMALLCGHARSGTTLLEYVLDSHPGIVSADETMVYHHKAYFPLGLANSSNASFVSTLDWMSARNMRQVRDGYFRGIESYLGEPIGDRLLMDKNPANTFDIPSIARIFPENKFVVALRDPRDVCLSCFMQPVPVIPDTASWLTLEGTIEHFGYIMGLWLAWKPHLGDMAIEVRYEDMIEDLEKSSRRTLDFLGLSWDERVMKFNEHVKDKIVRSPTFAEVTKPIYKTSLNRWQKYQKHFDPHMKKFEPYLRAFGYA
jgi:tetratricopeptide (TPR) repeat protein